jgi:hypothetical protein
MLSQRAQKYLAQLHRDEPLPVAKVEQIIIAQGYPAHPAWLAFHEQFAGYHENIGSGNTAIWGLAFPTPRKSGGDAYKVYVNLHLGVPFFIACADVHPSFDYNLMPDGEFIGPPFPSENFSIKVERNTLLWEFSSAGPVQRVYDVDGVSLFDLRQQLLDELRGYLVPEASDKFANYYASPTKVLLESLENNTLKLLVRA